MTTVLTPAVAEDTLADLVHRLGDLPLVRIRVQPAIGTAREDDLVLLEKPVCELVDGVFVDLAMGYYESRLAAVLIFFIESWLTDHRLGYCNGEGAPVRLERGLVRLPDVSFTSWDRVPDGQVPQTPICEIVPNLAVEILSAGNTLAEMERKRHEYFEASVEQVWIVHPSKRTVEVWSSPKDCHILDETEVLTAGTLLPGFQLKLTDWFGRADGPSRGRSGT